jgi:hypothetical protein
MLVGQSSLGQIFKHQGRRAAPGNECLDHWNGRIDTIA